MKLTIVAAVAIYTICMFFALELDATEMPMEDIPFVVEENKNEAWFVDHTCNGDTEVRLENRSRIDCKEKHYAIEYDWAYKWAECIGQALEYGRMTGLRSACALIIKQPTDMFYVEKMSMVISHYGLPITVFTIDAKFAAREEWKIR